MRDRDAVPPVSDRPARERLGELFVEQELDILDVGSGDEDLQVGAPAVVGRALGVEAEYVRTRAQERGGMAIALDERADDLPVEALRESQPRKEWPREESGRHVRRP
jgi:hypothetical protein